MRYESILITGFSRLKNFNLLFVLIDKLERKTKLASVLCCVVRLVHFQRINQKKMFQRLVCE